MAFLAQILNNQADSSKRFSEATNTVVKLQEYYLNRCEKSLLNNSEEPFLENFQFIEKVEELRYVIFSFNKSSYMT